MQKIFIDRNESAADVVEKILQNPDREITVVIPRNAALGVNGENLNFLKREAATQGKEIIIESVDEVVLALARANGVGAVHPLFAKSGGRTLSDIVPMASDAEADFAIAKSTAKKAGVKTKVGSKVKKGVIADESERTVRKLTIEADDEDDSDEDDSDEVEMRVVDEERQSSRWIPGSDDDMPRSSRRGRIWKIGVGVLAVAAIGAWITGMAFSKVTVTLEFKKQPWEYNGPLNVDKTDTKVDTATMTLPGEVFKEERNLTSLFPASGKISTSDKATGKITIYNAYNSASQQLVATTRFKTPDGKIFRLVSTVTVPGGKTVSGKLQPGQIDADIVADAAGPDYNVGPIDKLTIPGFQGTPKYDAFYGVISGATTGGVIGDKAVATAGDIANADDRTREQIAASLNSAVLRNQPAGFKVIDGASIITVTKVAVVSSTTEADKFGVFAEGNITAVAFRESDTEALARALSEPSSSGMTLVDITLNYGSSTADFDKGTLVTTLRASGTLTGTVNQDDLKKTLAGKSVDEAQKILLDLPNLSHAKIGIWPFWVSKIPANTGKIVIQAD
jgi:hypothetical protein